MSFLIEQAYAENGAAPAQQGDPMISILFFVGMIAIFYFLLIRPQQKRNKDHRQMISNLKKGDKIITTGGLHGRITGLDENTMTVEIADKVRVKVARANVAALSSAATVQQPKGDQK